MSLKQFLKFSLFIGLLTMTTTFALSDPDPIQCPSATSFTHIPGEEWIWNQPYANWHLLIQSMPIQSRLRTIPGDFDLVVFIYPKIKYIQCIYGSKKQSGDIYIESAQPIPVLNITKKLPSNFIDLSRKLKGSYGCETIASAPEKCAWAQ